MRHRLTSKINLIKELDKANRYHFSKKASLDDILVFEDKFDLKLPEDFKDFVVNVTNGIKDNKYNDVIFDETNFINYFAELDDENHNPYIEFPVTERTKDGTNGYDYDELTNGGIWLAGTGCGNGYMLIIKGESKGQVWLDELASNSEVIPWQKNFSDWMNSKLDGILKTLNPN